VFFAGETSTRKYVEAYYHLNHQASPQYVESLFGLLSVNPSPDFAVEDDVIEVKTMLIGLIVAVTLAALFLVLRL
jgi:hypothetical protein